MKKIAICGKGGSGKSVMVSLLANGLKQKGWKVLVVDSDESNTGLYRMLGFSRSPEPLIEFMGGKEKVEDEISVRIKSGVPEHLVNLMLREITVDEIPSKYILGNNGIKLVTVGKILMALEGCACPIGVVSRSFLKGLILQPDEVAVIDMEAGVEHFGRGIEASVDCVLMIVEPSLDSVEVAERISNLSNQIKIGDVWAILNKMASNEIAAELTAELKSRGLSVIGTISYSKEIFESCFKGRTLSVPAAEGDIEKILNFLFP
jgi:CO dehydrogenase maturation factor